MSLYYNKSTRFTLLQTYKVLKQELGFTKMPRGFTLLQTYKVLKLNRIITKRMQCFTLLQTYKVLKQMQSQILQMLVLHSYKLTRFSNSVQTYAISFEFYTLTNLQGSQTL